MVLTIDIMKLKNSINCLDSLINEYEEIQLNLFNKFKDVKNDWKDNNSIKYDDNIYSDKQESVHILNTLTDKNKINKFVYEKYKLFGKKINCDLNDKKKLLYIVDDCCKQTKDIIELFDDIEQNIYYSEHKNIMSQRNKIIYIKKELFEYRDAIKKIYEKIENIENEVRTKINELEELEIKNFEFEFNSGNASQKDNFIYKDLLTKDIEQIDYYIKEENKILNTIYYELKKNCNNYKTENTKLLLNIIKTEEEKIEKIFNKRTECIEILKNVINRYEMSSEIAIKEFKGDK